MACLHYFAFLSFQVEVSKLWAVVHSDWRFHSDLRALFNALNQLLISHHCSHPLPLTSEVSAAPALCQVLSGGREVLTRRCTDNTAMSGACSLELGYYHVAST